MKLSTSTFPFSRTVCGYTAEDPGDAGHHRLSCTACRSPFGVADLVTFEKYDPETRKGVTASGVVRAVADMDRDAWWLTVEVLWDVADLHAGQTVTIASGQAAAL